MSSSETGPLAIGQRFGPRYKIIHLLGLGGMGAVYQAWDSELDVVVALKVVRPEATSDPEETRVIERRFKQELLLARKVTHKNVVRIHDLGEIDGIKYITMSYIDGDDLATVLKKSGKLDVPAALKIMREVASGLLAAHEAGVVHRDLKPANIMVEGDHAVIMDFGIARSTSGGPPAMPSGNLPPGVWRHVRSVSEGTLAGTIVGTVAYMAPEQAKGEAVDQRADHYALGLMMSDMLLGAGRRRSGSESPIEELQRRMKEAPPTLRSVDPQIPEALDRIVSRCVQPDPAARFQTTAELVAALNRLDPNGKPLPLVRRLTPTMMAATAALVVAMLGGTYVVTRRAVEPPTQHEPVAVVIADFQNGTKDPAFDRTLEPMLRRALEGASFITAFDRNAIRRTLGVQPPERLDEVAARELAVKQGLGVVLASFLEPQGNGYSISVRATQAITGNVISTVQGRASSKDQVLEVATRLITRVRNALGDDESESSQMFAMTSVSATSLEVARHYAVALEASTNNKFEDAQQNLLKAVAVDPMFGIGFQSLAVVSRNLGKLQDAEKYMSEALRHLDGMTERERYNTRGMQFRLAGDYQQCVKEYGELITRYAADVVGHNQLALCLTKLRKMNEAVDEMRRMTELLPNRAIFRVNLSWYASYAGQFQTAEQEARAITEPDVYATHALAFALLGQGQVDQARASYEKLTTFGRQGASMAASGLGDLAVYQGRFSDAVRILEAGASADLKANTPDSAAAKLMSLAHAHLSRGNGRAAIAAAEQALMHSSAVSIRFLAARTFAEAGNTAGARREIERLASALELEPQAYAKIVEGEIALKSGDARQAIKLLQEANTQFDTWIGHFELGRAYLEVPGAETQADSAFDECLKRRGEALALFVDEEPTYGYLPSVYYYQGRVRENLKTSGFRDSYRQYLAIRGNSSEDPLLPEVRRRAGS
jgi:tetratricopeptide (TPR) repeat protein